MEIKTLMGAAVMERVFFIVNKASDRVMSATRPVTKVTVASLGISLVICC